MKVMLCSAPLVRHHIQIQRSVFLKPVEPMCCDQLIDAVTHRGYLHGIHVPFVRSKPLQDSLQSYGFDLSEIHWLREVDEELMLAVIGPVCSAVDVGRMLTIAIGKAHDYVEIVAVGAGSKGVERISFQVIAARDDVKSKLIHHTPCYGAAYRNSQQWIVTCKIIEPIVRYVYRSALPDRKHAHLGHLIVDFCIYAAFPRDMAEVKLVNLICTRRL